MVICIATDQYNTLAHTHLVSRRIETAMGIAIAVFNSLLSILTGELFLFSTGDNLLETRIRHFKPQAGRIWWISREARNLMGRPVHQKYKVIVTVMYVLPML